MTSLTVLKIGRGASVQDLGRPGHLAQGLSRGGAADRLAILEGAALLGQSPDLAAIELTALGGSFTIDAPTRIALTGAPMRARLGDASLRWSASYRMEPGEVLTLGPAKRGVWSYLHVGGGIATEPLMGSRAAHQSLGLGPILQEGDVLPLGTDGGGPVERHLEPQDRFAGGPIRLLPSAHTALFSHDDLERFQSTSFTRDQRGNRQGVRLSHDGAPFATKGQLGLPSEVVVPGDIQMTGEGTPYILLPECQTTGGYPRIGSVVPVDLPCAAQAGPGATLDFRFVSREEAMESHMSEADILSALEGATRPLLRDPREMQDLLSYQLISGVTAGDFVEGEDT
ncbi:biotin-dependent carboxyltransferase family protein [Palleronia sp. LCG004]|uniref:5-oxoprolinase subunit C family protein n=1 Tax=Palleronia sp. LCG004 TaxID=3079304 RepID=UPI0029436557|nr:biotin-dependent carboxyltransferase family protein [Palleronia sp. LCG004]WOI57408.1 biotin-dependent carboxyltransferase family protein [Palleronia sp. LCG004]